MNPTSTAARFGIKTGERLLIPESTASEYLADARIFPVPRAPRRPRGLDHPRGNALLAIDLAAHPDAASPPLRQANALIPGEGEEAFAVLSEHPPERLTPTPREASSSDVESDPAADVWCASALSGPVTAGGQRWWEVNLPVLVDLSLHQPETERV